MPGVRALERAGAIAVLRRLGGAPDIRYPEPVTADPFQLHPRLAADCRVIGDLPVCRLLLMRDARFPWCILVPRFAALRELHDLPRAVRPAVLDEIESVSRALAGLRAIDKFNVGALGNLVEQLHLHVVGRRSDDAAWPGPVWGSGTPTPYHADEEERLAAGLRQALAL